MITIGNRVCLLGDMHFHSNYSDGDLLQRDLAAAVNQGMDFVAVADHDTCGGSDAAMALLKSMGAPFPLVIRAQEVTGPGCHILAYNTVRDIPKMGTARDICHGIRQAGGYAVLAHPKWRHTQAAFWDTGLFHSLIQDGDADGFELLNLGMSDDEIVPVIQFYQNLLAKNAIVPITAGSDAHGSQAIGSGFIAVFAEKPTVPSLLKAIFEERLTCVVYQENGAIPSFTEKSRRAYSGQVLGSPDAMALYCQIEAQILEQRNRHRSFHYDVSLQESTDSLLFETVPPLPAEIYMANGYERNSQKDGSSAIVKTDGFAEGHALVLADDPIIGPTAAVLENSSAVKLSCRPALSDGKLLPRFTAEALSPAANGPLQISGTVNGSPFEALASANDEFNVMIPLKDDGTPNSCEAIVKRQKDGIPLGKLSDCFPAVLCRHQFQNATPLDGLDVKEPPSDGKPEVQATFRTAWDKHVLKIAIDVRKDCFCQPYTDFSIYMGDSAQIGIDPHCCRSQFNLVTAAVWEFGIGDTSKGLALPCFGCPNGHASSEIKAVNASVVHDSDGQKYTAEIPWEILGITPEPGLPIGLNIVVNINDGNGFRGVREWTRGIYDRKCAQLWGYAVLV